MDKNTTLESLNMECSDNDGFKIRYFLKTKNTDSVKSMYDDYKHSYKEEVFTKWAEASKRYKELADMRYKETA